ncbi:hypothetical protein FI667_g7300, partial [Globisporangium splendens]
MSVASSPLTTATRFPDSAAEKAELVVIAAPHVVAAQDLTHTDAAAWTLCASNLLHRLRVLVIRDQIESRPVLFGQEPLVERELGVRQLFHHVVDEKSLTAAVRWEERAILEAHFGPRLDAIQAVEMATGQHATLFCALEKPCEAADTVRHRSSYLVAASVAFV